MFALCCVVNVQARGAFGLVIVERLASSRRLDSYTYTPPTPWREDRPALSSGIPACLNKVFRRSARSKFLGRGGCGVVWLSLHAASHDAFSPPPISESMRPWAHSVRRSSPLALAARSSLARRGVRKTSLLEDARTSQSASQRCSASDCQAHVCQRNPPSTGTFS
jgi:hypothetical protein